MDYCDFPDTERTGSLLKNLSLHHTERHKKIKESMSNPAPNDTPEAEKRTPSRSDALLFGGKF
jgi:hypothetical protein